ncbi:hypothetical protein CMALT430_80038 [Carnobacterium maltaromaticum]|nr:hypothetical protein CMALT430_80038 [Carnobacterium maltaromaticum]
MGNIESYILGLALWFNLVLQEVRLIWSFWLWFTLDVGFMMR